MTALRYNPIKYYDELVDSGMNEKTAKLIARHDAEFASIINNESLATREDIKDLKNELKALELRMTIKFGAMMLTGVGILAFMLKN